jgi:hypothetical protein
MNLILSSITTAIVNLIVFSIIPFIWWFIRHRKKEGFFKWIGIYKPQLKSKWWVLVVFGLMHNMMYILAGLDVGMWYHTLMFVVTGVGALLLGWLNEKIFNGSIIPSILLHGAGNFISSMLVAFV